VKESAKRCHLKTGPGMEESCYTRGIVETDEGADALERRLGRCVKAVHSVPVAFDKR
jgi:hypothetical protein